MHEYVQNGYLIYKGSVDRTLALVLQMCSILCLHVNNISHMYSIYFLDWCYIQ